MEMLDPRSGLAHLTREECLALLAADEIGRLAIVDLGAPTVLPVNYVLDGANVVFRTAPGMKLERGPRGRAAFEIDSFDRATRTGWSVVAFGRLEEVTRFDSRAYTRVQALGVDPWASGSKQHWMQLVTERITGRRLGPA